VTGPTGCRFNTRWGTFTVPSLFPSFASVELRLPLTSARVDFTENNSGVERSGIFATTCWTMVIAAREESDSGREALETLCRTYWFPVYALVRRRGFDAETSRDFTQEFFARLLSKDGLARARRDRGRFRSFLAQSVKNFLADEWDRTRAQKRGGGQTVLSLDAEEMEGRYAAVDHSATPELDFDRQWAEQILLTARTRLETEYAADGKRALLEVLDRVGEPDSGGLAPAAEKMGLPLNTLKSHLRRARLRQAEIVRELIAETVESPAEVEAELRELLAAISR
jgi:DNA-directed RNA polymerase specialized sigma24 family protein